MIDEPWRSAIFGFNSLDNFIRDLFSRGISATRGFGTKSAQRRSLKESQSGKY